MSIYKESDMDEALKDFCDTSQNICDELLSLIPKAPPPFYKDFSQKIDRIMGAAQTLEIETIGDMCMKSKHLSAGIDNDISEEVNIGLIEHFKKVLGFITNIITSLIDKKDEVYSEKDLSSINDQFNYFSSLLNIEISNQCIDQADIDKFF